MRRWVPQTEHRWMSHRSACGRPIETPSQASERIAWATFSGAMPAGIAIGSGSIRSEERALAANGITKDVKEYPDVGHSFMNDHDSILFTLSGKLIGGGYDAAATEDARRRILAFFERELRPTS